MKIIRVLHIFNELSNDGNCHFVMNYYRYIDRTKIQFDFLVSTPDKGYFEDEIISMGGRVYHITPKRHLIRNLYETSSVVRKNHYDIVHRHTGNAIAYLDLRAAKIGGAKHLIIHSHNNLAGNMLSHNLSKRLFVFDCTRLACSREAGEFLFGNKSFEVIPNAIECSKFAYSKEKRGKLRRELGIIESKKVIGHVGRFEEQKNHKKLLEIFAAYSHQNTDSLLICVGDGSLIKNMKEYTGELGINERVLFLGSRADIPELMCVFDCFLFPSLYEGFGIVLLEAQASGLPCVVSDRVPKEVDLTGSIAFVSLESGVEQWVEKIEEALKEKERQNGCRKVVAAGYDLQSSAKDVQKFYLDLSTQGKI